MREKRVRKQARKNDYVYEHVRKKSRTQKKTNLSQDPSKSPTKLGNLQNLNQKNPPHPTTETPIVEPQMPQMPSTNSPQRPSRSPSPPTPAPPTLAPPNLEQAASPTQNQTDGSNSEDEVNKAIDKVYTSLSSGAAFSAGIENYIRRKRSLNLHKQRRKIFQRRRFVTHQPSDTIMADLIFYEGHKRANDNCKYILSVIDCFSRKAWTRPVKSKHAETVGKKLDEILSSMQHPPRRFCSDKGLGMTLI